MAPPKGRDKFPFCRLRTRSNSDTGGPLPGKKEFLKLPVNDNGKFAVYLNWQKKYRVSKKLFILSIREGVFPAPAA